MNDEQVGRGDKELKRGSKELKDEGGEEEEGGSGRMEWGTNQKTEKVQEAQIPKTLLTRGNVTSSKTNTHHGS